MFLCLNEKSSYIRGAITGATEFINNIVFFTKLIPKTKQIPSTKDKTQLLRRSNFVYKFRTLFMHKNMLSLIKKVLFTNIFTPVAFLHISEIFVAYQISLLMLPQLLFH